MPSFPLGPYDDPWHTTGLLSCDGCGLHAFSLRPHGDQRRMLCPTCYEIAETPTVPELPAVPTLPSFPPLPPLVLPEPIQPQTIYGQAVDERLGCVPEPEPGHTYCAAAWLAYLEASGHSFIPAGDPVLCSAHWRAAFEDALRQWPSLLLTPWKAPRLTRLLGEAYIRAAQIISARIAARQ